MGPCRPRFLDFLLSPIPKLDVIIERKTVSKSPISRPVTRSQLSSASWSWAELSRHTCRQDPIQSRDKTLFIKLHLVQS